VLVLHKRKSRVTPRHFVYAGGARVEPALQVHDFRQRYRLCPARLLRTMRVRRLCLVAKRGVENANGRLRRSLRRQTDIDKVSDEEIKDIVITANLTPQKNAWQELGKDVQIQFA
jgi:hypothetical protein